MSTTRGGKCVAHRYAPSQRFTPPMQTSRTNDRRDSPRFELVGSVWADIELPETAPVLNASDTGLLIESTVCPALNSRYAVTLRADDASRTVTTIVRHVRPTDWGGTFLVGLELVGASSGEAAVSHDVDDGFDRAFEAALQVDRRRAARRACEEAVYVDLNWPRPVRIVDISASGILLASRQWSSVGARGLLRFAFRKHHFVVAVELRRQTPYQDTSGFLLGARLLGLLDHQHGIIETLTASESPED